jgi:mono/diheme cytochrome c family protein
MMRPVVDLPFAAFASAFALSIASLVACGGSAPPANTGGDTTGGGTPSSGGGSGAATFADQVAMGQKLYGDNCASCHGPGGEGKGGAPAVVGLKTAKALPLDPPSSAKYRKTQFKTVGDVLDFSQKTMPPGAGGSLKPDEYLAIIAFDLHANGIDLPKPLTAEVAAATTIPR